MAFALRSGKRSWARAIGVAALVALSLPVLSACGTSRAARIAEADRQSAIAVNAYLWRASLDTLSFMPLLSADPYGGVIITDWYTNPEQPNERFKCTVYILDSRLRADGLNVTVIKEVSNGAGGWVTAPTSAQTETDIENAILTRARQLRLSNIRG
jgi:hypothetical protein